MEVHMATFSFNGTFHYLDEAALRVALESFHEDHGMHCGPALTDSVLSVVGKSIAVQCSLSSGLEAAWTGLLMQVSALSIGATDGSVLAVYVGGSSSGPTVQRVKVGPDGDMSEADGV
jgi:hypothetical protein